MSETIIDVSKYRNILGRKHQIVRFFWGIVWCVFARPLPRSIGRKWKRFLLCLFGAKMHPTAAVYSSAKVYYPAKLHYSPNMFYKKNWKTRLCHERDNNQIKLLIF